MRSRDQSRLLRLHIKVGWLLFTINVALVVWGLAVVVFYLCRGDAPPARVLMTVALGLGTFIMLLPSGPWWPRVATSQASERRDRVGACLEALAWFCRGDSRENIRAAAAGIRKDFRDMRKKGYGRFHILAVRFWITATTIMPIAWDGCVRVSKKLPLLGSAVRIASAFLRKIDPPRLG